MEWIGSSHCCTPCTPASSGLLQPSVITPKFSNYSQTVIFCRDDLKGRWLLFLVRIFQPLRGLQIKVTSLFIRSVKCSRGVSVPVALQSGFLKCDSGLSPSGSFTSVTPGAPWPSAWGRLAPWRKAASSPPSSSKSSSRRCCYHTSWPWAWGKKNRGLKTHFSLFSFETVTICHQNEKPPPWTHSSHSTGQKMWANALFSESQTICDVTKGLSRKTFRTLLSSRSLTKSAHMHFFTLDLK